MCTLYMYILVLIMLNYGFVLLCTWKYVYTCIENAFSCIHVYMDVCNSEPLI